MTTSSPGRGDVDGLGLELVRERGLLDLSAARFDDGLDFGAHIVDHLADHRTVLGATSFMPLSNAVKLALFAEELDARLIQCARIRSGGQLLFCGLQNALQFFFHGDSPL